MHFITFVLRLLVTQMMKICTGYPLLSTLSHWKALQGCRISHTMAPHFHLFIPQLLCNKQEEFLKLTLGKEKLFKKELWSGKVHVSFTCAEGVIFKQCWAEPRLNELGPLYQGSFSYILKGRAVEFYLLPQGLSYLGVR